MVDTTPTEAHLARLFLGSILCGVHLVSFGFCMKTLVWAKSRWGDINWAMLIVSFALITNATFDAAVNFEQALQAFVFNEAHGGALEVYLNISSWYNVVKVRTSIISGTIILIYIGQS